MYFSGIYKELLVEG